MSMIASAVGAVGKFITELSPPVTAGSEHSHSPRVFTKSLPPDQIPSALVRKAALEEPSTV
ncbi:MAG: hypothetical protein WAL27_13740 [Cellulosimicrobium cellulans]